MAVLPLSGNTDEVVRAGELLVDGYRFEAWLGERRLSLSPRTFRLLMFFAQHPGIVFSRAVLLDRVWGADLTVTERTVDVHVRWIREQIEREPSSPARLLTVRGVGYKLLAL